MTKRSEGGIPVCDYCGFADTQATPRQCCKAGADYDALREQLRLCNIDKLNAEARLAEAVEAGAKASSDLVDERYAHHITRSRKEGRAMSDIVERLKERCWPLNWRDELCMDAVYVIADLRERLAEADERHAATSRLLGN